MPLKSDVIVAARRASSCAVGHIPDFSQFVESLHGCQGMLLVFRCDQVSARLAQAQHCTVFAVLLVHDIFWNPV